MPAQTISLPSISNTRSTVANAPNRADKGASLAQKARLYSHAQQLLADARSGQVELKSRLDDATVSKKINVLKDPAAYRSEREMNLAHFRELLRVFQSAAVDKDGKMDVTQFKSVFSVVLGTGLTDEQMDVLFMKIDANTDDAIDWDEFSTFMLLRAEGQTAMREAAETRLFNADTMTKIVTPHRETINKILYLSGHKRFMTCSRDGTVCYWSDKMKLQRSYKNIGARRPQSPNKKKGFSPAPPKVFGQPHQRWVHDCIYMEDTSKVVMSSDDHEVTIYDYTTMETQIRLDLHDTVALSLDSYHDPENPESDQTTLILGTDSGHILFFTFSPLLLFSATGKKKDDPPPLINLTSARSLKTFGATLWKRKSHNDWTLKVQYFADLKSVVSCSPDSRNSFCMGTEVGKGKWSFVTASVYRGVNTFAFCKFPICLVTGGTDRQIRLWNPYRLSNPMAALRGHSSPITDITINPINGQIISLSVDKQIRIWDIRKQQCLQTLFDHVEHKPEDVLTRVFFSKVHARLIAASTIMETYKLRDPPARGAEVPRTPAAGEEGGEASLGLDLVGGHANGGAGGVQGVVGGEAQSMAVGVPVGSVGGVNHMVKSHDNPVRAALYNVNFTQVVSGCDAGVVNVWDIFTGAKTFQFSGIHGKSETTAMAFDSGGRRLVTGGRDGTIRTWNFNNGQQLQELVKADDSEVTSIAYLDTRDSKFFVATGWNRKITLFPDSPTMFNVYPSSEWPTEGSGERPLHHDDVLSLACYPPHLLATSSYDGEIVVCNLQSGHVLHRLRSLELEEGGGRSVDKVIFLTDRNTSLDASLISSGADGMIRWWNAEQGYLCWEVDGSQGRGEGIYAMRANTSGTLLITGDAFGWITCWDISDTCVDEDNKGPESYVMPILDTWRAHRRCIVSVDLAEAVGCVVTAGTDGCVRLFTLKGEYIGTFGQMTLWNISNPSTWMHPFLPPDVEAALQEEEADHEAVERLKTVAKKMTNFARQRKTSKSLKSLAGGQNPQQPKPTRVPPLVRAPSKQAVTTTRIRTPAHATEKPATPVRRTPPPKTADLLRRDYNTWYTNSLFAKEEFHRHFPHHQKPSIPPIGDSFGDRMDHAGTVGQNLRIYNKLKPYELTDVSQLLQTSSVVGIGKGSK